MKTDKMLTLSILDYDNGKITLSGQHEEVIVARKNGEIERIDTFELGFFVGMEPEIRDHIKQYEIRLAPGDGMVLYTDGITEAFNASKKMYGIERLCELIRAHWDKPAAAIKQEVIEDINGYIGTTDLVDDITLVVLKQK